QRKILTGWSDVNPAPAADDTAFEVKDLSAGLEYCFRIRALTSDAKSRFTKPFCVQTLPAAEPVPSPSPSATPSSTPSSTASPTPGASPAVTPSPSGSALQAPSGQESLPRLAELPN
ncbi:MAG: fibronectin type III domain-containing protein, partial [Actinomycetales bacterium]